MRTRFTLAAVFLLAAMPALPHHSFAAEFDVNKPLKLRGIVTKWELTNPHSWIHLDVTDAGGATVAWMVEGGSPNALFRLGFDRNSLPPGTEILVEGYRSKDNSNRAVGARLTFADGRQLFMGGSAPNATPGDAATPRKE